MKYLKTYETIKSPPEYKPGDYVKIALFFIPTLNMKWQKIPTKIGDSIFKSYAKIVTIKQFTNSYGIEFISTKTNDILTHWLDEKDILRSLTPEEIDEFETKLIANKYNL